MCLNPFEFRAGLKLEKAAAKPGQNGLNPFEFRAGLKRPILQYLQSEECLNPFEFRAGLKHFSRERRRGLCVLIPLNSGLA